MTKEGYVKLYGLIGKTFSFILICLIGYTIGAFFFIQFGGNKNFTWYTYWGVAKVVLLIMAALIILGWIVMRLHKSSRENTN